MLGRIELPGQGRQHPGQIEIGSEVALGPPLELVVQLVTLKYP